ncbi:MAG: hypothetical protein IPG53_14040 [Ignavibacteriales bacterium]|nr:hypothetical protein [Ignavibacteriales bacterium]
MMSEYVAAPSVWSNRIGEVRMMPVTGASLLTDIPKIDFLAMERGKEKDTITLQMINVGSQQLIINSLGLSNSAFSLAGQLSYPLTINSFDSLAISVVCNPQTAGMLYDTLVLVDNDPVENRIPIRVESFDLNPVAPQKILVVTNSTNGGGTLLINKSTGESTLLGSAGANSFNSISANPKTGVIYGFRAKVGDKLF